MIQECKDYLNEVDSHVSKLNALVKTAREAVLAYEKGRAMELPPNKLHTLRDGMKEATQQVDSLMIFAPDFNLF